MRGIEYDTGIISKIKHASFDDSQDWETWHAVLEDHIIQVPEPKTAYLEVPGRNGTLDYSEAITGAPVFNDRTITMQFAFVDPVEANRISDADSFVNSIHGRRKKITFDYLEGYFSGRCSCEKKIENDGQRIVVTVTATCLPMRYASNLLGSTDFQSFMKTSEAVETQFRVNNTFEDRILVINVIGRNIGRIQIGVSGQDNEDWDVYNVYGVGHHILPDVCNKTGVIDFDFLPTRDNDNGEMIGSRDDPAVFKAEVYANKEVL